MSDREREIRKRLRDDFPHYASRCLKIRSKSGGMMSLNLNSAQAYIHQCIEAQRREKGWVRAIILKGRQQGCSTYVEGRFYWKVTHKTGKRAFILTHEQEATDNLFEMANRYHEHCPDLVKPETGAANAKELDFTRLDSGYRVATAGNKGAGRSATLQFFHGSEVAYWPNAELHASGVLQAIPRTTDTEVILESTAFGQGNYFHKLWVEAESGESDFIAVFVPWFWQEEYRDTAPADFTPDDDELLLIEAFKLSPDQLMWRRAKIRELGGETLGLESFHREYPCTPEEAFQASLEDLVILPILCKAAKAREVEPPEMIRPVWGVDVARFGNDANCLAKRQGNVQLGVTREWRGKDTMQTAGIVAAEYEDADPFDRPSEILVDVIGIGAGVVDRLSELGLPVRGINVGESASSKPRFQRLRDELWWRAREWLEARDSKLADDPDLERELTTVKYKNESNGKIKVESKEDMKERGVPSPNRADAWCLTFAGGLDRRDAEEIDKYARKKRKPQGSWMSA